MIAALSDVGVAVKKPVELATVADAAGDAFVEVAGAVHGRRVVADVSVPVQDWLPFYGAWACGLRNWGQDVCRRESEEDRHVGIIRSVEVMFAERDLTRQCVGCESMFEFWCILEL